MGPHPRVSEDDPVQLGVVLQLKLTRSNWGIVLQLQLQLQLLLRGYIYIYIYNINIILNIYPPKDGPHLDSPHNVNHVTRSGDVPA